MSLARGPVTVRCSRWGQCICLYSEVGCPPDGVFEVMAFSNWFWFCLELFVSMALFYNGEAF
ncbi:hypothetical protein F2Q70_00043737 [Brassica cretica]|uniref:Uncharacterized protein n=1 Tax=Brassica cretica TaxID=69181 RepID=A0A8S9KL23_BRACR|nr:hypothetical protein F2Q70_00043737 [Brassica cretica]